MAHCQELTGDEEKDKSSTWKSNNALIEISFKDDVNQKGQ